MKGQLVIENLSAGYGGTEIIRNLSLTLNEGEFCALLGLNASGKTTLLKAVSGLIKQKEGRCLLGGEDFTCLNEHARANFISYIPQRHSPMYGVSVLDAVMMGFTASLGLFESPGPDDRALALETLDRLGLRASAKDDFSQLSEGQKQMVILARTLVQNAPVMLLDEPDSALDFNNRHAMLNKVRTLVKEEGKIGLISIHDPNYALEYCDRLVLLANGTIVDDVEIAGSDGDKLRTSLSRIYGEIKVTKMDGRFIMMHHLLPS